LIQPEPQPFGLATFGIATFGLATFGIATFGLATFGIATFGLATFGIAMASLDLSLLITLIRSLKERLEYKLLNYLLTFLCVTSVNNMNNKQKG